MKHHIVFIVSAELLTTCQICNIFSFKFAIYFLSPLLCTVEIDIIIERNSVKIGMYCVSALSYLVKYDRYGVHVNNFHARLFFLTKPHRKLLINVTLNQCY